MKRTLMALAVLCACALGLSPAQAVTPPHLWAPQPGTAAIYDASGLLTGVAANPLAVIQPSSTSVEIGSTVVTHLVFQSALAASATRKGCLVVNTSTDKEFVYFGATVSATTSNSVPLLAGQALNCASGSVVATDNIAISSNAVDGATYVVVSQ